MWQELGIEPTADPRAIRAAYARHLKDIDPGRDLEAFQRLRQAYEAALDSLRTASGSPSPRCSSPPRCCRGTERWRGGTGVPLRHQPSSAIIRDASQERK
jgi:hypothetical protein